MSWEHRNVPIKFQLSDITLFSVHVPLQTRALRLGEILSLSGAQIPPAEAPAAGSEGFFVHSVPVPAELPRVGVLDGYLRYVPLQYQHCYIALTGSFADYEAKFSSKTRSTIRRKIRKFAEHCGGEIRWEAFKTPDRMRAFIELARQVSKKTYQERLLDAGIPATEEFRRQLETLASEVRVRGYVLFDRDRPVSYLYCPVLEGVAIYAYLGYDPDYMKMSVGTVLQWLAVEQLFAEGECRYFDFTEGESDHKRLFATEQVRCANVILLRNTLRNRALVFGHAGMDRFSKAIGDLLARWGVKSKVRQFLRFARAPREGLQPSKTTDEASARFVRR